MQTWILGSTKLTSMIMMLTVATTAAIAAVLNPAIRSVVTSCYDDCFGVA